MYWCIVIVFFLEFVFGIVIKYYGIIYYKELNLEMWSIKYLILCLKLKKKIIFNFFLLVVIKIIKVIYMNILFNLV